MTRVWPRLNGPTSRNASTWSSSYTRWQGISPRRILLKIVSGTRTSHDTERHQGRPATVARPRRPAQFRSGRGRNETPGRLDVERVGQLRRVSQGLTIPGGAVLVLVLPVLARR